MPEGIRTKAIRRTSVRKDGKVTFTAAPVITLEARLAKHAETTARRKAVVETRRALKAQEAAAVAPVVPMPANPVLEQLNALKAA